MAGRCFCLCHFNGSFCSSCTWRVTETAQCIHSWRFGDVWIFNQAQKISSHPHCLILWYLILNSQDLILFVSSPVSSLSLLCFGEGQFLKATPGKSVSVTPSHTLPLPELTGKAGSAPHQSAHCRQTQLPDKNLLETWLAGKINLPCYLQRNHPSFSITSKECTWVIFLITQRTFLKYFQLSNLPQAFSISSIDHPVAWFYLWQLFVLYFKFLSAVPIIPVSFASCPKPQHHSTQFPEPLLGNIPLPTWISPW